MKPRSGNAFIGILICGLFVWGAISFLGDAEKAKVEPSDYSGPSYGSYPSGYYSDYSESEPVVGFSGTDTMEACNNDSGRCYDLEIDSDGENIERINFPNGGWRDVSYSDCDDGYCIVEDEDGIEWELQY